MQKVPDQFGSVITGSSNFTKAGLSQLLTLSDTKKYKGRLLINVDT